MKKLAAVAALSLFAATAYATGPGGSVTVHSGAINGTVSSISTGSSVVATQINGYGSSSQTSFGETGGVQRGPEAVARPGEVMPDRPRVQPRVDAAEQDAQVRPNHVRDLPAVRPGDLLAGRLPGIGHARFSIGLFIPAIMAYLTGGSKPCPFRTSR